MVHIGGKTRHNHHTPETYLPPGPSLTAHDQKQSTPGPSRYAQERGRVGSTTRVQGCDTQCTIAQIQLVHAMGLKSPMPLSHMCFSLTDVIPACNRFIQPDMQDSRQVHICAARAELKAPPHSIRALYMVPSGHKPTSRKHAPAHMICTDTERRGTSPRT